MAAAVPHQPPGQVPLIQRWQGCLQAQPAVLRRLEWLAAILLMVLLSGLPFLSRSGMAVVMVACGLIWLLWSLCTPPTRIEPPGSWLLLIIGIAILPPRV